MPMTIESKVEQPSVWGFKVGADDGISPRD